jgi:hypothetical protein
MTIRFKYSSGLMATLLLLAACKKDKIDFENDNRPVIENQKRSNVRIINLSNYNQVIANGDTLTNFIVKTPSDPTSNRYPGTQYFPDNGRLGKLWEVPMDLFGAGEKSALTIASREYSGGNNSTINFTAENSYSNPTDYILLPFEYITGQPEVVAVTRGVTGPLKPDHFKVRVINLTANIKSPAFTVEGAQEDLTGAVTLMYANGTPVNDKTSHVSTATRVSEYVEVPYGTYQFRVLTENGKQLPASPASGEDYSYSLIAPASSSLTPKYGAFANLVYAPISVYQPGGVYTIVVTPQRYNFHINELDETSFTYQNSFQVINDISPAANTTYCRVQGVNALRNENISISANGKSVTAALGFGQAGEYASLINGTYTIEAKDAAGKVLATAQQALRANMNYTAWLYPGTDGSGRLVIVANDLSGTQYLGNSDDGTYDRLKLNYFFFKRFLNLSPDNQYITFTLNNGQPMTAQGDMTGPSVNLRLGEPVAEQPYVGTRYDAAPYELMAYRSGPAVVPGVWANDIPVLTSQDFIANKTLYTSAGKTLPVHEPGIFTVALIGSTGNMAPKAKMMIVKHNK